MNRRLAWTVSTTAVLFVALAAPIGRAAPAGATAPATIRDCIAAEARKLDFSGVVLLAQPRDLAVYAQGALAAAGSPPITAETRFNLGSAGKMFTAVAVAQLIDAGKIALDDPIGRYVDGLTPEASTVTIRQLLNHSSGLGNYFAPENLPALIKAKTLRDLLPLVARETPAFQPGSRFAYSDSGFLLLGLAIEKVSGRGYGDYLSAHIFEPARMTSTTLEPASPAGTALGMTAMLAPSQGPSALAPGPLRPAQEARLEGGSAGGSFSTVGDMLRFFAALAQGKLTSGASLQMLVSPQIVVAKANGAQPERDYGFGFGVGRFEGHSWFGHNGGAPGVNTETAVFPDDQITFVVLANRDPPTASLLFHRLRDTLFGPQATKACGLRRTP